MTKKRNDSSATFSYLSPKHTPTPTLEPAPVLFTPPEHNPTQSVKQKMSTPLQTTLVFLIYVAPHIATTQTAHADTQGHAETSAARPNIIFILTDDQRADSVGFMGNSVCQTPNLDKLASEGTIFERAYVTSAICTPSRACYLLGQYERRHGINFNSGTSMSPEAWSKSYPVLLREAGYFTGYIGKNHLPIGDKGYFTELMDQSFDYWYAGHHHLSFYPKERHEIFDNAQADTQVEIAQEGILSFLDPGNNTAFMSDAIRFLETRDPSKPFCLSVCLNVPHGASTRSMRMQPQDPEIYRTLYRDQIDTLPLPKTYTPKENIRASKLPEDVLLADLRQTNYAYVDTPQALRETLVRQYQTITGVDRMIGELRQKLDRLDLTDDTILIFSSDHGIMLGEFGLGGKALCYEEALKVPMIVFDPRAQAAGSGIRSQDLVLSVDVAPTLLDYAGVPIPDTVQGQSLRPIVDGQNVDWRQAAFGENLWSNIFGNPRCETVRTKDWRYIRYFKNDNRELRTRTPKNKMYTNTPEISGNYAKHLASTIQGEPPVYEELFHLAQDPHQEHNLANAPEHQAKLNELRTQCQQLVTQARGGVGTPPATLPIAPQWAKTRYRSTRQD